MLIDAFDRAKSKWPQADGLWCAGHLFMLVARLRAVVGGHSYGTHHARAVQHGNPTAGMILVFEYPQWGLGCRLGSP